MNNFVVKRSPGESGGEIRRVGVFERRGGILAEDPMNNHAPLISRGITMNGYDVYARRDGRNSLYEEIVIAKKGEERMFKLGNADEVLHTLLAPANGSSFVAITRQEIMNTQGGDGIVTFHETWRRIKFNLDGEQPVQESVVLEHQGSSYPMEWLVLGGTVVHNVWGNRKE